MAHLYTALSVELEADLLPLSALLHQRGVRHRVCEERGRQVLKVERQEQIELVRELHHAWRNGEVSIELQRKRSSAPQASQLQWRSAPVTVGLGVSSIAVFFLFYLGAPFEWMALLSFVPFEISNGEILFGSAQGQYWRLVTPAFLHFGWLHIVFNCLWLWDLGSRIERVLGSLNMLLLFLMIDIVANVSQYMTTGPGLFGGMSGVVYGLLGFAWVAPLLQPRWKIQPAPTIMLFMVGWLVLCMVGVVEVLGFGAIANAAHLGGLICGLGLGTAFGLLSRHNNPG